MATKPIVLPDPFNGEGSWTEWKYHFGNVAQVNGWNDAQKLQWLRVRLTGRAQRAVQRVDTGASFSDTVKALDERFEPQSRQTRYQAEFQTRRKKRAEGWAEFADDLKMLADKGFPDLSEEAKEQLALQTYLQQLEQPQITFGVKQRRPKTLDEAVTATIEMETYLPASSRVPVAMCEPEDESTELATIAPVSDTTAKLASLIERLVERVEKLEQQAGPRMQQLGASYSARRVSRASRSRAASGACWNCGVPGHFARDCRRNRPSSQGN